MAGVFSSIVHSCFVRPGTLHTSVWLHAIVFAVTILLTSFALYYYCFPYWFYYFEQFIFFMRGYINIRCIQRLLCSLFSGCYFTCTLFPLFSIASMIASFGVLNSNYISCVNLSTSSTLVLLVVAWVSFQLQLHPLQHLVMRINYLFPPLLIGAVLCSGSCIPLFLLIILSLLLFLYVCVSPLLKEGFFGQASTLQGYIFFESCLFFLLSIFSSGQGASYLVTAVTRQLLFCAGLFLKLKHIIMIKT